MTAGYSYVAVQPIYITSLSGSQVLAFAVGDFVPDSSVTAYGWDTAGLVMLIGDPNPSHPPYDVFGAAAGLAIILGA
jgi:hypothetical protein